MESLKGFSALLLLVIVMNLKADSIFAGEL